LRGVIFVGTDLQLVPGQRCHWIMGKQDGMKVDGIVFATEEIIQDLIGTKALWQVKKRCISTGNFESISGNA